MTDWLHDRLDRWRSPEAERRLLPPAGWRSPIILLVALMSFIALMVAAGGLALRRGAVAVEDAGARQYVLQWTGAGATARARDATARLAREPGIAAAVPVAEAEVRALARDWLGAAASDPSLPVPALVDVRLADDADGAAIEPRLRSLAPGASIDRYATRLGPVERAMKGLALLTLGVVGLIALAVAAAVTLAARGAVEGHRATIRVMHGVGATDDQVARLFERRIAVEALGGAAVGAAVAGLVILLVVGLAARPAGGMRLLAPVDAVWLLLIPVGLALLARRVARFSILSALGEDL